MSGVLGGLQNQRKKKKSDRGDKSKKKARSPQQVCGLVSPGPVLNNGAVPRIGRQNAFQKKTSVRKKNGNAKKGEKKKKKSSNPSCTGCEHLKTEKSKKEGTTWDTGSGSRAIRESLEGTPGSTVIPTSLKPTPTPETGKELR